MKDYLLELTGRADNTEAARCLMREYLQARTLEALQEGGAFADWAFVGGTALRFLYSLPRFSEDLDFSIREPGVEDKFLAHLKRIKKKFSDEGYQIEIKAKADKTVRSAFIKFPALPYEMGLSPHRNETLSIKIEIDSNPPAGANLETSIVRRHCLLNLQHYDKSSLLAGKLHALLSRKYTKGRDLYDLMWYLSDSTWPMPNIQLLNNALSQSGALAGTTVTGNNWRQFLAERIAGFDWNQVLADARPFVEKQSVLGMLTADNILKLLAG